MTEQISQVTREKTLKKEKVKEVKVQVLAMEDITVSLTQQTQEKDSEIEQLRADLTEKDLEIARIMKDFDQVNSQLRQSLEKEQRNVQSLRIETSDLKEELIHAQEETQQTQTTQANLAE